MAAQTESPSRALLEARALRRAGHFDKALSAYARAERSLVGDAETLRNARWERIRMDLSRGRPAPCGLVVKRASDFAACQAETFLLTERATEAEPLAKKAVALEPASYPALLALSRTEAFLMNDKEAEGHLRAALSQVPAGAFTADLELASLLTRLGRFGEAKNVLGEANKRVPGEPEILLSLAKAVRPDAEAKGLLEEAVRIRPSFGEAWLALAEFRTEAGASDALAAAREAARLLPEKARAWVVLSEAHVAAGEGDKAVAAAAKALSLAKNAADAHAAMAQALLLKGDLDTALSHFQAAWGTDRTKPDPLVRASVALKEAGRITSAKAYARKATEEFPKWGPGWEALGDALSANHESTPAKRAYEEALRVEGPTDKAKIQTKLGALGK